jgi:hypothetical protein
MRDVTVLAAADPINLFAAKRRSGAPFTAIAAGFSLEIGFHGMSVQVDHAITLELIAHPA